VSIAIHSRGGIWDPRWDLGLFVSIIHTEILMELNYTAKTTYNNICEKSKVKKAKAGDR